MFNAMADSAGVTKDRRIRLQRDSYTGIDVLQEAYKATHISKMAPLSVHPRPITIHWKLNGRRRKIAPFPLALRSTLRLDPLVISSFTSCRWDRVGTSGRFAETNELGGDKIEGVLGLGRTLDREGLCLGLLV